MLVLEIAKEIWDITAEASPYLLLGFLLAGLIRSVFNEEQIKKRLGGRTIKSVILAALFGVPLPLCSCGVMPVATSLRKSGASRSATSSFLISTPESGVDSISISYALLDPLLTVIRPIVAFATAIFAGSLTNFFEKGEKQDTVSEQSSFYYEGNDKKPEKRFLQNLVKGILYSFFDLLPSISLYLLQGLILAGMISYLIPGSWIQQYMSSGITAMLLMLVIGIPMYICATSSTPIAAALIAKGMSPGTALVFLLAGPATNFATMVLVNKILGRKYLVLYLFSIAICAIIFGLVVDIIYLRLGIEAIVTIKQTAHELPQIVGNTSGIILSILVFYGIWLENIRPKWAKNRK